MKALTTSLLMILIVFTACKDAKEPNEIVPEPKGAAHADPTAAAEILNEYLGPEFDKLIRGDPEARLDNRYEKFRRMGNFGLEGLDDVESGLTAEDR